MSKIKTIIMCLAIGMVICINAYAQTTIQRSFVKKADFNLDGKLEEVHLIIYGEKFNMPFRWDLSVEMGDQKIFHHTCDDSWLDDFFNDPGYYTDSRESYEVQKTKYYFNDLPEKIVVKKRISEEAWSNNDYWLKNYIGNNIQYELKKKYNIVGKKAQAIVEASILSLTQGVDSLSISCNPLSGTEEFIFIPEIKAFVRYYAP